MPFTYGQRGVAVTVMKPFGKVQIDGEKHEARVANSGWIDIDAEIAVVASDSRGLVVQLAVDVDLESTASEEGSIPTVSERKEMEEAERRLLAANERRRQLRLRIGLMLAGFLLASAAAALVIPFASLALVDAISGLLVCGTWGAVLGWAVEGFLRQEVEQGIVPLIFFAAGGFGLLSHFAVPQWGMLAGCTAAAVASLVLGWMSAMLICFLSAL